MIAVNPIQQLPQLVPVIIVLVFAGRGVPDVSVLVTIIVVPLVTIVPWLVTRYQVTADHVRVRSGLLTRKVATARRDRIRSVDLTASPPQRMLGLKKVTIGTGGDEKSSAVHLNAIAAADAVALHDLLMATTRTATGATPLPATPPEVLSRLQVSWLRFAPFSLTGLATAAAASGLGIQFANEAGLFDRGASVAEHAARRLEQVPIVVTVLVVLVLVMVIGAVLSVSAYVLGFWNFTLTRHRDDHTLHVSRGLLTTNAMSLDEHRIRGVHFEQPVLMRPVGGARLHAIATGAKKHPLLLPPAPLAEAVRVGQLVAHDGDELTTPLIPHGRPALIRRLTRGLWTGVIIAVVIVGLVIGPLSWSWLILAAAIVLVSTAIGLLRYRNLGHRVTSRSVVFAPPKLSRHRNVIDRSGVVGWASHASFFQRRRGVETLVLATAAGAEAYSAVDLEPRVAAAIMTEVSPGLVAPFIDTVR